MYERNKIIKKIKKHGKLGDIKCRTLTSLFVCKRIFHMAHFIFKEYFFWLVSIISFREKRF